MADLVVPYDATRPERYAEEAVRLRGALGAVLVEVEHVGSTAVPGIAAKPRVDIAIGVSALADIGADEIEAMEKLGYVYRGEAGVAGRHYFRKGDRYPRDYHVSIVEWRGALWSDYLLLRDFLRRHPEQAALYVEAKRAAVRAIERPEPIAYWEHKRAFVEALLERARATEGD